MKELRAKLFETKLRTDFPATWQCCTLWSEVCVGTTTLYTRQVNRPQLLYLVTVTVHQWNDIQCPLEYILLCEKAPT